MLMTANRDEKTRTTNEGDSNVDDIPTILFLSLVHGNEPLGMMALLSTIQLLTQDNDANFRQLRDDGHGLAKACRVLFFPIVNVDAYTLNLEYGKGCRRTNLRDVCSNETSSVKACPDISHDGVDLNRNYPIDWDGPFNAISSDWCMYNHKGPYPFSEPETRAIRDVVMNSAYKVTAAMSFHTRTELSAPPLLIHPYTSERPINAMSDNDRQRYRSWSRALNKAADDRYTTGTAMEAIQYTAGGSTIDWLQSAMNVTAFVVEVTPPCANRWCDNGRAVYNVAYYEALTAQRFVDLVMYGRLLSQHQGGRIPGSVVVTAVSVGVLVLIVCRWRHRLVSSIRRKLMIKEKTVVEVESEMQSLSGGNECNT